MSEYSEVENPFLQQLAEQGWTVIDQGTGVPQDAAPSLRDNFRQWLLPSVFDAAVRSINRTNDGPSSGKEWLTDRQLEDLKNQFRVDTPGCVKGFMVPDIVLFVNDLHFHWKCLMAPPTVIDYIVVHELCHLHHRDHSEAFWNEVDKVLPDYRDRKE